MVLSHDLSQSSDDSNVLQNILEQNNPFEHHTFVKQSDIWDPIFSDLSTLNSTASEQILQTMMRCQARQYTQGITITAEKGLGKSHFIRRICHNLQKDNAGFFIYMNEFTDLGNIKDEFFKALAHSLKQDIKSRFTQWQRLAALMFNSAFSTKYSVTDIVEKIFPQHIRKLSESDKTVRDWIVNISRRLCQKDSNLNNTSLITAILWSLSRPHEPFVRDWLSGKEIEPNHAAGLGLPISITEGNQSGLFTIAHQVLGLINEHAPVLICFDELDSLADDGDSAVKPRMVSSLAKDILNNLKCGVVLTTMYPQTWATHIKTMPQAEAVIDRIGQEIIELEYLNTKNIVNFIEVWLRDFYLNHGITPPSPTYPFRESELVEIGEDRPTLREALTECKKLFKKKVQAKSQRDHVEVAYEEEIQVIEDSINEYMENSSIIEKALKLGFSSLVGQTINGVEIRGIEDITPKSPADRGYVKWKLIVKEGHIHRVGVTVIQEDGGSVAATLRRLLDYEKFELTRGCLVRSKMLSDKAKMANELVRKLIFEQKGEWVWLEEEHIKPLIALALVEERKEDYSVTTEQILSFIRKQSLALNNPLLAEVLSKPSGRLPRNATISDAISRPVSPESTGNTDGDVITVDPNDTSWVKTITALADRSLEEETGTKTAYHAGTDFELIVRQSLEFLGFTVENEYRGGAGGLDFYCSAPFQIIGECKAGRSIPSRTVEQLVRLGGRHIGTGEIFKNAKKLIIGPGIPTPDVLAAAMNWQISIMTAKTLQKLVMTSIEYPGAVRPTDFKDYLIPGLVDNSIDAFIKQKVMPPMTKRAELLQFVKSHLKTYDTAEASTTDLWNKYQNSKPLEPINDHDFYLMLIELASPLTRYLQRKPGDSWLTDRFYFLRDLIV